jgi:hypothetical protein
VTPLPEPPVLEGAAELVVTATTELVVAAAVVVAATAVVVGTAGAGAELVLGLAARVEDSPLAKGQ